jgi:hypothetical protein
MRLVLRRVLIGSILALLLAGPAGAGTIIVKLTFVPGKLTMKAAPATLAPGARVSVPLTIADGRGNGNGWTLKVAGSSTVSVVSITATCAANSTCTLPSAVGTPSGATVLRAAKGTGMGVMNLVVTLSSQTKTAVSFAVS